MTVGELKRALEPFDDSKHVYVHEEASNSYRIVTGVTPPRHARKATAPRRTLTIDQAQTIRSEYEKGLRDPEPLAHLDLALKYKVTPGVVSSILSNATYQDGVVSLEVYDSPQGQAYRRRLVARQK